MGIHNHKSDVAVLINLVNNANLRQVYGKNHRGAAYRKLQQSGMPEAFIAPVFGDSSSNVRTVAISWLLKNIKS